MSLLFAISFFLVSTTAQAADKVPTVELLARASNGTEVVRADPLGVIVVDFSGDFCTPCKVNEPHVRAFAARYGWSLVIINVEDAGTDSLRKKYNITFVPRYLVFSKGVLIDVIDFDSYSTKETVEQARARINARFGKTAKLLGQ